MVSRAPLLVFLSVALGVIVKPQNVGHDLAPSSACAVTVPNQSQPPVKNFGGTVTYASDYQGSRDAPIKEAHGNGKLWTILWPDGTVTFRTGGPGFVLPDGSLSMKWPWYRAVAGRLTIQGRRLDAPAAPLRAAVPEGYGDLGFQSSALIFPAEGCWEVAGRVGNTAALTFVTRVVRQ